MPILTNIKGFLQYRKEMLARNPNKNDRMRGVSTAQALEAIAKAIRHPNSKIELIDHAADYAYGANEHLMQITASIIELLHLEGFTFDKNKNKNKNWYLKFSFEPKLGDK